jgi:phage terminase large subunit-like protein
MRVKRIQSKAEGNELYPLPADYETLTPDGQREARVNACRQWLVPTDDPEEKADRFAASLLFFESWYLWPDPDDEFDPMFYDDKPVVTPKGHVAIYREWAKNSASLVIAPRGYAKSNCIRKSIIMQMLTRPQFSFIYATSTNDNAKHSGQIIKSQFIENERIVNDFSPEFPDGRIAPKRGEASFGIEMMYLKNGSWFRAISAESRQRGGRPRCYVLDDPEYDPKASTSMAILRQYMDTLLFKVVAPMLTRPDTSVRWLATFVSRRHFAWYAMETEETKKGHVARDPRFSHWTRMVIQAAYETPDLKTVSCWPEMWPVDRATKAKDPELKSRISLEEIKDRIGSANFLAEYMARPGESDDAFFPLLKREKHGWWFEEVDPLLETAPYASEALVCWGVDNRIPLHEFLREATLFIACDTSFTDTPDSDFKVATLMACTPENELFVLDMWAGQTNENELVKAAFKMADRWRVKTIHPEVIKEGISLYNNMEAIVRQRAKEMVGISHLPKIVPFRPGLTRKEAKIAALQFRFEHGLIKMPLHKRLDRPWRELFDQIEQFNPDAKDGGLAKDDHLDTVSMSNLILRGRTVRSFVEPEDDRTPIQRITDGEYLDGEGIPWMSRVDFGSVAVSEILNALQPEENHGGPSRV